MEDSGSNSAGQATAANKSPDDGKDTIEGPSLEGGGFEQPLIHKLKQLSVARSRDSTPLANRGGSSEEEKLPQTPSSSVRSTPTTPAANLSMMTTPSEGNSPSTSQVSVGSVPPTLTAALLPGSRHYDLTPVTRNTSSETTKYVDNTRSTDSAVISPDDGGFLHGELLALPADLSVPDAAGGPTLPPLIQSSGRTEATAAGSQAEETFLPIQFPSRKFYSFTSRQQYEEAMRHHPQEQHPQESMDGLTPYQPSRVQVLGDDFGGIPDEELQQIFIDRHEGESHSNHRLQNPIPMEDRQFSIPSIRLANHLNGSVTSCTEDEESLLYAHDDASLSSRASSLCFPDDMQSTDAAVNLPARDTFHPPELMMDVVVQHQQEEREEARTEEADDSSRAVDGDRDTSARRKRRKEEREERVYEWLQSVEADQNVLAEAASSRFLTGQLKDTTPTTQTFALNSSFHSLENHEPEGARRRQTLPIRPRDVAVPTTAALHEDVQHAASFIRRQASSPPTLGGQQPKTNEHSL